METIQIGGYKNKECVMGKLKRLSSEIVSILILEDLTFNQIVRELGEPRETITDVIDIMMLDGLIQKKSSLYSVTEKAKTIFSCWE